MFYFINMQRNYTVSSQELYIRSEGGATGKEGLGGGGGDKKIEKKARGT